MFDYVCLIQPTGLRLGYSYCYDQILIEFRSSFIVSELFRLESLYLNEYQYV